MNITYFHLCIHLLGVYIIYASAWTVQYVSHGMALRHSWSVLNYQLAIANKYKYEPSVWQEAAEDGTRHQILTLFLGFLGSLLDFLKDGEGRGLKLPNLVDMAAQVRCWK